MRLENGDAKTQVKVGREVASPQRLPRAARQPVSFADGRAHVSLRPRSAVLEPPTQPPTSQSRWIVKKENSRLNKTRSHRKQKKRFRLSLPSAYTRVPAAALGVVAQGRARERRAPENPRLARVCASTEVFVERRVGSAKEDAQVEELAVHAVLVLVEMVALCQTTRTNERAAAFA